MVRRPDSLQSGHGRLLRSLAAGFCLALALPWAAAQQPSATVSKPAARPPAGGKPTVATRPSWAELTVAQQQALAPLSGSWGGISEAQKRKWLAMSQNFPRMPPAEQARLHSRMTEWVNLSPQQRTQARLNFGETKQLSQDDKKAKWEAYQALPPEQKRKLAAGAPARTPTTAAAVKPVPAQKLATVPPRSRGDIKPPRIAAGPTPDADSLAPVVPPAAKPP
jgi:hypothetical protein